MEAHIVQQHPKYSNYLKRLYNFFEKFLISRLESNSDRLYILLSKKIIRFKKLDFERSNRRILCGKGQTKAI